MHTRAGFLTVLLAVLVASGVLVGCESPQTDVATQSVSAGGLQEVGGQEEFGPYEVVHPFPQPLPDGADGVTHDGWTWGSIGGVYAEPPTGE